MNKEPFLQVSKRRNKAGWQERLLIRFIALILALIVCGAVIVALVKMNPVDVYKESYCRLFPRSYLLLEISSPEESPR